MYYPEHVKALYNSEKKLHLASILDPKCKGDDERKDARARLVHYSKNREENCLTIDEITNMHQATS